MQNYIRLALQRQQKKKIFVNPHIVVIGRNIEIKLLQQSYGIKQ